VSTPMRLREASTRLTAIAAEIDRVVGGLVSAGGEETWLGPAADDYRSAVRIRRRSASEAAEDLTRLAADLDAAADLLAHRLAERAEEAERALLARYVSAAAAGRAPGGGGAGGAGGSSVPCLIPGGCPAPVRRTGAA